MRFVPVLIAAACLALPAGATKPTPETPLGTPEDAALAGPPLVVQENTYRFGDLLRSEPATSVDACAKACHLDARCVAWSMTPKSYSTEGRCELKSNPGAASFRPGAVSGISESVRMEPEMRYKVRIPEGYQSAPVMEDELLGADVAAPVSMPDLLGARETKITAVMKPAAVPAPPVKTARTAPPLPPPPTEPVIQIADAPSAPTKTPAPVAFKLTKLKPAPGALQSLAPAPSEKAEAFNAQASSEPAS